MSAGSSRSIRSSTGRLSLGPSSSVGVAFKSRGGALTLPPRERRTDANSRKALVCSAIASGVQPESESSPAVPKPNQGFNLLLKLVRLVGFFLWNL